MPDPVAHQMRPIFDARRAALTFSFWAVFAFPVVAKGFPFATNFGLNEISGLAVAKGCSKTNG